MVPDGRRKVNMLTRAGRALICQREKSEAKNWDESAEFPAILALAVIGLEHNLEYGAAGIKIKLGRKAARRRTTSVIGKPSHHAHQAQGCERGVRRASPLHPRHRTRH